jgi:glutathione S-transferase
MLTLYDHPKSGNCHKIRLLLSILQLPYRSVFIDVPNGANREPSFIAINPLRQIPVLVDADYTIQDSQAILLYLGHRSAPDWIGRDAREVGDIAQWLSFAANEIANSLQPARLFYLLGEAIDIGAAQAKSMRAERPGRPSGVQAVAGRRPADDRRSGLLSVRGIGARRASATGRIYPCHGLDRPHCRP